MLDFNTILRELQMPGFCNKFPNIGERLGWEIPRKIATKEVFTPIVNIFFARPKYRDETSTAPFEAATIETEGKNTIKENDEPGCTCSLRTNC